MTSDPASPLLEKLSPDVRALMQELRALMKEALPFATERVYLGWGNIHYQVGGGMRSMLVALDPQRGYINIEFADGAELPDPAGRLEGKGRKLRHVKIRSSADAQSPEIRALLQTAARYRGLS